MNVTPPDAKSEGTLFGGVIDWYQSQELIHLRIHNQTHIRHSAISPFYHSADDTTDSDYTKTPPFTYSWYNHFTETTFLSGGQLQLLVPLDASYGSCRGQLIPPGRGVPVFNINGTVIIVDCEDEGHRSVTSSDSSADALSDSASSRLSSISFIAASHRVRDSSHLLKPLVRGADLVMDVNVVRSDGIEIDPEIQAEIDKCFAYAYSLRDRGIDVRVVVEAVDRGGSRDEYEGPVKVESLRELRESRGARIVGAESAVTVLTKRVIELERDNRRLRGTANCPISVKVRSLTTPEAWQFMAISVILVSSDSLEDNVGHLLDELSCSIPIIAPTIPPSPDYTSASPDYSLASDSEYDPSEDPSSDHILPLPAISPFLSSADDTTDSDTPETPPSPTHGTPFTETTLSTQRSPTTAGAL
ncbi:hypothetical protein Tco_0399694 [Tanacetum coccineum]